MPTKTRTILLPDDFDAWFERLAKTHGVSWENAAREALLRYGIQMAKESATAVETKEQKPPKA